MTLREIAAGFGDAVEIIAAPSGPGQVLVESNVIEVITDAGDLYQIGLKYDIPQSQVGRKARLANGTFNDLDGLEHYRAEFLAEHVDDPHLAAFQIVEDLRLAAKGVDDLTQLPEGAARSEVVRMLANLRNVAPKAAGILNVQ